MSDQISPAPAQVSQPHAPPTTATAQPTNNSPPAPAAAAPLATTFAAPAPQNATPAEEPQTLNDKLNAVDRYWKFKLAFQVALVITGVIGIGTIAWTISNRASVEFFDYDGYYYQWPGLVPFVVSVLWCLICILVLVLHKKPVHPGACVALDLLLWLGFIFSVMFAMIGLLNLESWGEDGSLGYGYSSSGGYQLASNGTWVWYRTDSSSSTYGQQPRDCNGTIYLSGYGYTSSEFNSCSELDAYVNKAWQEKPHRVSVVLTAVVCQFFGIVLHFALFVWACIDCHRHRRSKTNKDAEKIAAEIVQKMITNGAIIPPPGQPRPMVWGQPGYYQLPQQPAVPMQNMYPPQNGGPAGSVAGPVNEKTQGPRYA